MKNSPPSVAQSSAPTEASLIAHFRLRSLNVSGHGRKLMSVFRDAIVVSTPQPAADASAVLLSVVPHASIFKLGLDLKNFDDEQLLDALPADFPSSRMREVFPRSQIVPMERIQRFRVHRWNPTVIVLYGERLLQVRTVYVSIKLTKGNWKADAESGCYLDPSYRILSNHREFSECMAPLLEERFVSNVSRSITPSS